MSPRLWLLVIFAFAGALAPSRADARGAETRAQGFFATAANSRPESAPQVAGSHQGFAACGYEFTSGYSQAAETGAGGNYLVYQSVNEAGEVQYVGITSDFEAREAAHLAGNNGSGVSFQIDPITGLDGLSLGDARAAEQTLIDTYGLGKNGGSLLNRINSISPTSDPQFYINSSFRWQDLLRSAGYPGF
jgi:filamentous hemagglutinin